MWKKVDYLFRLPAGMNLKANSCIMWHSRWRARIEMVVGAEINTFSRLTPTGHTHTLASRPTPTPVPVYRHFKNLQLPPTLNTESRNLYSCAPDSVVGREKWQVRTFNLALT